MKNTYTLLVVLIGFLLLTAATVKAQSSIHVYNKTTSSFNYTNAQIIQAFNTAMPVATFTAFTLEIQGSDKFIYATGTLNDSPSVNVGYPIQVVDNGNWLDINSETVTGGTPNYCRASMCTICEYIFGSRNCDCKKDWTEGGFPFPGRCYPAYKPDGTDPEFLSVMQQFTPIQQ